MREYKFKAKKLDTEEWVYGHFFYGKSPYDATSKKEAFIQNDNGTFKVDANTVCEYIGQHDKNNSEIYENDILQYETGAEFLVVFDKMPIMCPKDKINLDSYGYYGMLIGDEIKELCPLGDTENLCKVIGNIKNYLKPTEKEKKKVDENIDENIKELREMIDSDIESAGGIEEFNQYCCANEVITSWIDRIIDIIEMDRWNE